MLPQQYRKQIVRLARELPFSGHLSTEKTTQRVLRRVYWPSLFTDIKDYCQSCPDCQLHPSYKTTATMIPLPLIGEPF